MFLYLKSEADKRFKNLVFLLTLHVNIYLSIARDLYISIYNLLMNFPDIIRVF